MIDARLVPKVHPLDRLAEAEDPMELMAEPMPGDPAVMLECVLQEFAWMGWNREQLLSLFSNPGYPVLCQLREYFGDEEVERRVAALLTQWGTMRFRETIAEPDFDDEDEDDAPPLYQIRLPAP